MEGIEPIVRIVAETGSDAVEQVHGLGATRQDRQVIGETIQAKLGDHGVQALLDQELPRLRQELLADQGELSSAETEALHVVPLGGMGIGKEDFVIYIVDADIVIKLT